MLICGETMERDWFGEARMIAQGTPMPVHPQHVKAVIQKLADMTIELAALNAVLEIEEERLCENCGEPGDLHEVEEPNDPGAYGIGSYSKETICTKCATARYGKPSVN